MIETRAGPAARRRRHRGRSQTTTTLISFSRTATCVDLDGVKAEAGAGPEKSRSDRKLCAAAAAGGGVRVCTTTARDSSSVSRHRVRQKRQADLIEPARAGRPFQHRSSAALIQRDRIRNHRRAARTIHRHPQRATRRRSDANLGQTGKRPGRSLWGKRECHGCSRILSCRCRELYGTEALRTKVKPGGVTALRLPTRRHAEGGCSAGTAVSFASAAPAGSRRKFNSSAFRRLQTTRQRSLSEHEGDYYAHPPDPYDRGHRNPPFCDQGVATRDIGSRWPRAHDSRGSGPEHRPGRDGGAGP